MYAGLAKGKDYELWMKAFGNSSRVISQTGLTPSSGPPLKLECGAVRVDGLAPGNQDFRLPQDVDDLLR